MTQLFDAYLDRLLDLHRDIARVLDELPEEAFDWSVGPDMNSIGVLVTHLCGAERFWLGDGAIQDRSGRVRAEEFLASGSRGEALKQRLAEADAYAQLVMDRLGPADLDLERTLPGWERTFSVAWCLLHALEHTAVHTGHIQLTAQLWAQRNA